MPGTYPSLIEKKQNLVGTATINKRNLLHIVSLHLEHGIAEPARHASQDSENVRHRGRRHHQCLPEACVHDSAARPRKSLSSRGGAALLRTIDGVRRDLLGGGGGRAGVARSNYSSRG